MTGITDIRVVDGAAFKRIMEIDRSEQVSERYTVIDGALQLRRVSLDIPRWSWKGPGPHSYEHKVSAWLPILQKGGILLGAFQDEAMVGLAIYRPKLAVGTGQLVALYVNRDHRGQGIGRALFEAVVKHARDEGNQQLYVSSTPTRATVDFYLSRGCRLADKPDPDLSALEPDDIHLILHLNP